MKNLTTAAILLAFIAFCAYSCQKEAMEPSPEINDPPVATDYTLAAYCPESDKWL